MDTFKLGTYFIFLLKTKNNGNLDVSLGKGDVLLIPLT